MLTALLILLTFCNGKWTFVNCTVDLVDFFATVSGRRDLNAIANDKPTALNTPAKQKPIEKPKSKPNINYPQFHPPVRLSPSNPQTQPGLAASTTTIAIIDTATTTNRKDFQITDRLLVVFGYIFTKTLAQMNNYIHTKNHDCAGLDYDPGRSPPPRHTFALISTLALFLPLRSVESLASPSTPSPFPRTSYPHLYICPRGINAFACTFRLQAYSATRSGVHTPKHQRAQTGMHA